jgi:hypothetical protein
LASSPVRAPGTRSDAPIAGLVLASIALVLLAPVAGRAGLTRLADASMGLAAAAGLLAFAVAAFHTFRARHRVTPGHEERSQS